MNVKSLIEIMREAGLTPYEYKPDESHGRMCLAVNTGDPVNCVLDIINVVAGHGDDDPDTDVGEIVQYLCQVLLRSPRQKNVGSEIILYWPRVEWP